ncbi:hypothetical protein YC2023_072388 [Brassica napus]
MGRKLISRVIPHAVGQNPSQGPEEKKLTRIPLVTASEPGRAQLENRTSLAFEL